MKNNGLFFTRNDCRQAAARENMKLKAVGNEDFVTEWRTGE